MIDALSIIENSNSLNNLHKFCSMAIKSRLLPESIDTPEKAFIIAVKGIELGIAPMQAFSQIHVIKGRPAIASELMLGLIYKNVPTAEITFIKSDSTSCIIKCRRHREQEFSEFSFTLEDARRAYLVPAKPDSGWTKYPQAMLRARAISSMARAMFPDAVMGASYTPEELQAIEQPAPQAESFPPPIEIVSHNEIPLKEPTFPVYTMPEKVKKILDEKKSKVEDIINSNPQLKDAVNIVRQEYPDVTIEEASTDMDYIITFGKFRGKTIKEIGLSEAEKYARYLKQESIKSKKNLSPTAQKFTDIVEDLLGPVTSTQQQAIDDQIPF